MISKALDHMSGEARPDERSAQILRSTEHAASVRPDGSNLHAVISP